MLSPGEIAALEFNLGLYLSCSASSATRQIAWSTICGMCARGGAAMVDVAAATTVQTAMGSAALSAAEVSGLRAIAARVVAKNAGKTGMTMAVEKFIPRLAANFAACPKGPGPIVGVTIVLTMLMTATDVYAVTQDAQNYQQYLIKYSTFLAARIAQGHLGRGGHIPSPMLFEEYQKNPII